MATLPGVWPGRWMIRGEPGRSSVTPSREGRDLGQRRDPQGAVARAVGEEAEERPDLHRTPAGHRLLDLAAGAPGVELVDEDRDATFAAESLGEADVVGVPVGQDDRPHVVERATHRGQLGRQVAPEAGQAGVDDRDLAALFDEVAVDEARAEPVERLRELHRDLPVVYGLRSSLYYIAIIATVNSHGRTTPCRHRLEPRSTRSSPPAASILDADGLDGLTMQRVAAAVGVRGAVALQARSGIARDLVRLIANDVAGELTRTLEAAATSGDPAVDLRAIAGAFRAWALAHPEAYHLLFDRLPEGERVDPEVNARSAAALLRTAAGARPAGARARGRPDGRRLGQRLPEHGAGRGVSPGRRRRSAFEYGVERLTRAIQR